jgi:hypothetical protein
MYFRCRNVALRVKEPRNHRSGSELAFGNAAHRSQPFAFHPTVDRLQGKSRPHTSHILPASNALFRTDHTAAALFQILICIKLFDISTSIYAIHGKDETYNPSQGKPGKGKVKARETWGKLGKPRESGGKLGKARES